MFITCEQFEHLSEHLGFSMWPRAMGNPRQQFVYAAEDVWRQFRIWNGKTSCFISTQGYSNLVYEQGGRQVPRSVLYGLTFFDFDHDTKPENALADAQRLSQYLTGIGVAHWVQYSGSKGYHLQIVHTPTRFKFGIADGSAEALREIVHQVQAHLKTTLGLNTLDAQTMGDPKRLCRFPFTAHIDRHGCKSGRYSMLIDTDTLDQIDHTVIEKDAFTPQFFMPDITGERFSIKQFIDLIGVDLESPEARIKPIIDYDFGFSSSDEAASRFLASMKQKCMGVVNELKRRNPPHKARVHAAIYAKVIGMRQAEFERVWVEMGTDVGYVDLHNTEYRAYQMATLFDNPNITAAANCTTLKRDGCCVGDICPKFKDTASWIDEVETHSIKRQWRPKR